MCGDMMIRIIDSIEKIRKLFEISKISKQNWEEYFLNTCPKLISTIYEDADKYNYDEQIIPLFENIRSNPSRLDNLHMNFMLAVKDLEIRMVDILGETIDFTIIFYLGLGNAAGWAFRQGDDGYLLLGVEKIIELNWDELLDLQALLYHEAGHLIHQKYQVDDLDKDYDGVWRLYIEGLAMVIEQELLMNESYFHQNKAGWLESIRRLENIYINDFRRRVNLRLSTDDYFGDWCNVFDISDVGYYLGHKFVRRLLEKYSLNELLKMDKLKVEEEFGLLF